MLENLKAATFKVFETMFFLFPEAAAEAEVRFQGPAFQVWSPISGPKSFKVGLTVPLALAQKMAANFLGLEEDGLPEEQLVDVLRETVNMVAGDFLGREQASIAFHPEPPLSIRVDYADPKWRPHPHSLLFIVDDAGLEVFLARIK
jgi:hypothetical protein